LDENDLSHLTVREAHIIAKGSAGGINVGLTETEEESLYHFPKLVVGSRGQRYKLSHRQNPKH